MLRCIEAIKEIENKCWSCGNLLDPTKLKDTYREKEEIKPIIEEDSNNFSNLAENKSRDKYK